ncbi:hypothetical protein SAMN02745166_02089 [Prosthecobacter debontii]|uniref:Uncharacterized protein n=1 Tax=Prosthecobacter debontii TaxID=48467 RepID=A0A1T4XVD5_9BACT|nr:hypothetical protein [Prosthecobacter debontii]SKA93363.1 hypothetical protein SAMN02745166_02089 [Prosthecobacter debontii]
MKIILSVFAAVILVAVVVLFVRESLIDPSNNATDILVVDSLAKYAQLNQKLPADWEAFLRFNHSQGDHLTVTTAQLNGRLKISWGLASKDAAKEPILIWTIANSEWIPDPDLTERLKGLLKPSP